MDPFAETSGPVRFPVATQQKAAVINGKHTDVVLSQFADKNFVLVTQTEKMGTMVCLIIKLGNILFNLSHN